MSRRFPTLARAPLSEARVCQYENSANGDFLIDWHPRLNNVLLVGGGSGHGFKHGPALAEQLLPALRDGGALPERFALGARAPGRSLRTAGSN